MPVTFLLGQTASPGKGKMQSLDAQTNYLGNKKWAMVFIFFIESVSNLPDYLL